MRGSTATILLSLVLVACETPPAETREWTVADHDRAEEERNAASGAKAESPEALMDRAWQQLCFSCHGAEGRGDGPKAAESQPADLTRADWQAKVTDAELGASIKNGKGRMPKFDLPDPVIKAFVARVRSLARPAASPSPPAADAASPKPAPSAGPSASAKKP